MNSLRAGKYIFRAAYILVWVFILAIVAAPILGAVTPQYTPSNEMGVGVNLQTVQPQLQKILYSPSGTGNYTVTIPAFNRWFFPASVGLSLDLAASNGTTVYHTSEASISLAPFQSGMLNLTMDLSQSVVSQLQGQITGGGQMTLQEDGLWTISVSLGGVE